MRGLSATRLVIATIAPVILGSLSIQAQIVRGVVIDATSNAPISRAVLTVTSVSDGSVRRALSDPGGRFEIALPTQGSYTLNAKQIGRRPSEIAVANLAVGEAREIRVVLAPLPVTQPAVVVEVGRSCAPIGLSAQPLLDLWSDAKAGLAAVELGVGDRTFPVAITTFARDLEPGSLRVLSGRHQTINGPTSRPFKSVPEEELAQHGYVVTHPSNVTVYRAPDAAILLSDAFARDHCFQLVTSRTREDVGPPAARQSTGPEIGIAFRPTAQRTVPDIRGVFWIDVHSRMLRDVGFSYTSFDSLDDARGLGGRVEFSTTPSGRWIVSRWLLRLPVTRTIMTANDIGGRDSPPPRERVTIAHIHEIGGDVAVIDAVGSRAVQGVNKGRIIGRAFDSIAGAPLRGATISGAGIPTTTISDLRGEFTFDSISPGLYRLELRHPRLDSLGLPPLERDVRVAVDSIAEILIDVPSTPIVVRRLCSTTHTTVLLDSARGLDSAVHTTTYGVLRGTVKARDGGAVSAATVEMSWTEFARNPASLKLEQRLMRVGTTTDSSGRYLFCALPTQRSLILRTTPIAGGGLAPVVDTLRLAPNSIGVRDIVIPPR